MRADWQGNIGIAVVNLLLFDPNVEGLWIMVLTA